MFLRPFSSARPLPSRKATAAQAHRALHCTLLEPRVLLDAAAAHTAQEAMAQQEAAPPPEPDHAHQAHAGDNGRLLLVYEPSDPGNVPLFESRDDGDSFKGIGSVDESAHPGDKRWALRWQPHLSELARSSGELPAGTLMVRGDQVCAKGFDRKTNSFVEAYDSPYLDASLLLLAAGGFIGDVCSGRC